MRKFYWIPIAVVALSASAGRGEDWSSVPYIAHSTYQAVNPDGTSAYAGGFPIRLVGVVLNNTEDWLDPTPAYTPEYVPFAMGGQAELYVQALWRSTLPALGVEYYDPADFGGTACWMGQNYGNLPFKGDPAFSYTDAEWTAELGRLNLWGGDAVTDPIRAGDLVEIRARGGLHYRGKMNVNEQHNNDRDPSTGQVPTDGTGAHDFHIVRLLAGFGLPDPAPISLSDLKNSDDTCIFDPTRLSGGERYQSTLVRLQNVRLAQAAEWTANSELTVTDGLRTFTLRLGRNGDFDGTELFAAGEHFHVVGILDQYSTSGTYGTDGYRLLAMSPADFCAALPGDANCDGLVNVQDLSILATNWMTQPAAWDDGDFNGDTLVNVQDLSILATNWTDGAPAPEPASAALLALAGLGMLARRKR